MSQTRGQRTLYLSYKLGRQHTVALLVAAISPFMSLIRVTSEVTTVVVLDHTNGETCPTLFEQQCELSGSFMSPALQSSVIKEG